MPPRHPEPGKFDQDHRVAFDKTAGKWQYEDEESGQEFEWNDHAKAWLPLLDESSWKAQQAAYSVAGVDETTPSNAVLARQQRIEQQKKRKAGEAVDVTDTTVHSGSNAEASASASANGNGNGPSSSSAGPSSSSNQKATPAPPHTPAKKTAVWVTGLPPDATAEAIAAVFSKAGVLMIGDDGEPRIKLYYDDDGNFKGEALVMYFKEGSVTLAVTLLDDTELEMGGGFGNMRVKEADYDASSRQKTNEDKAAKKQEGEKKAEKKKLTAEEKQRMTKRIKRMQDKVTWHSDDEEDDPLAPADGAPRPGQNRYNRVVVLKGMFTLQDLDKDPALLLELKEDVREECETLGQVTSCTLFDKEEDGVMTIKFKEATAAQACVLKMNGRFFDGRKIYAGLFTGKERYQRTTKGIDLEDDERDERERLDNFAQWLVDEDGE